MLDRRLNEAFNRQFNALTEAENTEVKEEMPTKELLLAYYKDLMQHRGWYPDGPMQYVYDGNFKGFSDAYKEAVLEYIYDTYEKSLRKRSLSRKASDKALKKLVKDLSDRIDTVSTKEQYYDLVDELEKLYREDNLINTAVYDELYSILKYDINVDELFDDEEAMDKFLNTESLNEDTVKLNGKWVNKGKEGTHGEFKTKKEADAQRKAMFARGFKEAVISKSPRHYSNILIDFIEEEIVEPVSTLKDLIKFVSDDVIKAFLNEYDLLEDTNECLEEAKRDISGFEGTLANVFTKHLKEFNTARTPTEVFNLANDILADEGVNTNAPSVVKFLSALQRSKSLFNSLSIISNYTLAGSGLSKI